MYFSIILTISIAVGAATAAGEYQIQLLLLNALITMQDIVMIYAEVFNGNKAILVAIVR